MWGYVLRRGAAFTTAVLAPLLVWWRLGSSAGVLVAAACAALLTGVFVLTWVRHRRPVAAAEIVRQLNERFEGHATVIALPARLPRFENLGVARDAPEAAAELRLTRTSLRKNEDHALVERDDRSGLLPASVVRFRVTDFASVQWRRRAGERPALISTCGVLFSPERRVLWLHERGPGVATYPGKVHTIGGGLIPQRTPGQSQRYDGDLSAALLREVLEETGAGLAAPPAHTPWLWGIELPTGFVQFVCLGLPLELHSFPEARFEGRPIAQPFDDLPRALRDPRWVPSGLLYVVAWLGLGAPGCPGARFDGLGPAQLYRQLIADRHWPGLSNAQRSVLECT